MCARGFGTHAHLNLYIYVYWTWEARSRPVFLSLSLSLSFFQSFFLSSVPGDSVNLPPIPPSPRPLEVVKHPELPLRDGRDLPPVRLGVVVKVSRVPVVAHLGHDGGLQLPGDEKK